MSTTQQQIAEVFERHLEQHGYDKTNLDDVARELRISKKTIYVHFDGKREIYGYIVERLAARNKAQFSAAIASLPTFSAKLEAILTMLLELGRAHIAETGRDEWLREYEVAADAYRKAMGDLMRELVEQGMAAGEFPPGDAELVERMVGAMTLEYLKAVNDDPAYDRDQELRERIMRFVG